MNPARLCTLSAALALITAGACQLPPEGGSADEDTGVIRAAIRGVPSDAGCLRVTVNAFLNVYKDNYRTIVQTFTLTTDPEQVLEFKGLPYDLWLTATAEAFSGACSALTPTSVAKYAAIRSAELVLERGPVDYMYFELVPAASSQVHVHIRYLDVAPMAKDFGSVYVGSESAATVFTATNFGSVPTTPLSVKNTSSGQFKIGANTCTAVLAPGATCQVAISFKPTVAGPRSNEWLYVEADLGGDPHIALSGVGLPSQLTISPTSRAFGNLAVGAQSADFVFTTSNTGTDPTGPTMPTLSGANPADFAVTSNVCSRTQVCQVKVRFTPKATGPRSATLTVSASPGGAVTATLTGSGT